MTPRIVKVTHDPNPDSPIRQIVRDELAKPERLALLKAEHDAYLRGLVRDELASLGGHLAATYGAKDVPVEDRGMASPKITHRTDPGRPDLATLGGFLLEHFGQPDKEDA